MQVVDEVEPANVDSSDSRDVHLSGNDGDDVDGVEAERDDQASVAETKTLLQNPSDQVCGKSSCLWFSLYLNLCICIFSAEY